ncbi:MAG: carboxymuconolactone decarboxylase family protein [Planctomycetota bacterium]|nr:carboxymuconolactone decarboxylase family protein [Planctomycetaceae bacterium]MDQ3331342.1 carboxymuconolactone decarboxylase family protein [Planctomycetota bacterium]
MPRIAPLPESAATDKAAQTYGRLRELFGDKPVPDAFLPMGRVPAFVSDFYMNFKKFVMTGGAIDAKTKAVIALSVALKEGSHGWSDFYSDHATANGVTEEQIAEIAALVATNAMYNTFFKFRELAGSELFSGMAVGLRAHTFHGTSFDEKTVELINVAISDLNACKPCVSGHVKKARDLGLSDDAILETIQCASAAYAGVQFTKSAES